MTRAKEQLHLTCAGQRMLFGRTSANRPSRFVEEIPPEHLERSGRQRIPSHRLDGEDHALSKRLVADHVALGENSRPLGRKTPEVFLYLCKKLDVENER